MKFTLRRIQAWLVAEGLLVILMVLRPVPLRAVPTHLGGLAYLVGWKTVAAPAGLMVLSRDT